MKNGVNVKLLEDKMSEDISSIWLQIVKKGPMKLIVGGTYREHRFLHQLDEHSASPQAQPLRWKKTVEQWAEAGNGTDCIMMGDCNIDTLKLKNPDKAIAPLIATLEDRIIS